MDIVVSISFWIVSRFIWRFCISYLVSFYQSFVALQTVMLWLFKKHISMKVLLAMFLSSIRTELHFEFLFFLPLLRMHALCSTAAWELINIWFKRSFIFKIVIASSTCDDDAFGATAMFHWFFGFLHFDLSSWSWRLRRISLISVVVIRFHCFYALLVMIKYSYSYYN